MGIVEQKVWSSDQVNEVYVFYYALKFTLDTKRQEWKLLEKNCD